MTDHMILHVLVLFCAYATRADSHAHLEVPPARNWVAASQNPDKKCLGGTGCAKKSWGGPYPCQEGKKYGCEETNHWSLQAGGPALVRERSKSTTHPKGQWPSPAHSHGLCGDPVQDRAARKEFYENWREEQYMVPTPPQATYNAGDIVEFKICVHAHHMGFNEFRICESGLDGKKLESVQAGQDCLDKWVLKRAPPKPDCIPNDRRPDCQPIDELHPGRWHWPSGMYDSMQTKGFQNHTVVPPVKAGADWDDSFMDSHSDVLMAGNCYTQRYVIPEGLSCQNCTLQWWWVSGNQCLFDSDVPKYMKRMQELGWQPFTRAEAICSANGAYGEEFWNCADINVKGKSEPTPLPTTPAPSSRRRLQRRRRRRRSSGRRRRSTRRRASRRRSTRRRRR